MEKEDRHLNDKYELLISIKMLQHEISELTLYIEESRYCYELLTNKLDHLSKFVVSEENNEQWQLWGEDEEIIKYSERLRDTSSKAICTIEKYQSLCTAKNQMVISEYMDSLSGTVKKEIDSFDITVQSKVLFIGSGAFPISALTLAKEAGAEVMCLDIDNEAITMGRNIAELTGLHTKVSFSNKTASELTFVNDATHVIIASLVKNKLEVLEDLKEVLPQDAKVILRYGNGLKSIFNYPLDQELSDGWRKLENLQIEHFYDTVVLRKIGDSSACNTLERIN